MSNLKNRLKKIEQAAEHQIVKEDLSSLTDGELEARYEKGLRMDGYRGPIAAVNGAKYFRLLEKDVEEEPLGTSATEYLSDLNRQLGLEP